MRICKYKNCDNEVTGRKDKVFCCKQCKHLEKQIRKNQKKLIENAVNKEMKNVEFIKLIRNYDPS